jgi:nucleoside-diphosphate-sugar epimerase
MRIAITGGSGRVGRATVERAFALGHSVVSLDQRKPDHIIESDRVTYIEADISDYDALERAFAGCDALIHLAAIPSPRSHPEHIVHNNNVVGSYNAMMAAVKNGIRKICQASSINATGAVYSRWPRYDYLPLDEEHPTYNEDPYSLSKWICEIQADSLVRRYEDLTIASLRYHGVYPQQPEFKTSIDDVTEHDAAHLWGYCLLESVVRANLAAIEANYVGHEVFYIVSPRNSTTIPSLELKAKFFPDVEVRGDLSGLNGFYDCSKAERILGWKHDLS